MTPILHASTCPQCGGDGGSCASGETCLPDDYIDPADCPPASCPDGEDCLPEDYIDPSTCLCLEGSYSPYCITANADDVETVILSLSPWAYFPLDDASGLPQDASGNGRHSTGAGGTSLFYADPPITTKRSASIRFEGGYFILPRPVNFDANASWTVVWLEEAIAFRGSGSPAQAGAMWGHVVGSNASPLTLLNGAVGDWYTLLGEQSGIGLASYIPNARLVGRTSVLAIRGDIASQPDLWVDGVQWGAAQNGGTGPGGNLTVGASDNGFWGYPNHRMSDFAIFDRGLTRAEMRTITEVLVDSALLAGAVVALT